MPLCECSTSLQFQQRGVGDHLKVKGHMKSTLVYSWCDSSWIMDISRKDSVTFQPMLVSTMRCQCKQFGHSKVYIHCSSTLADQQCSHFPGRKSQHFKTGFLIDKPGKVWHPPQSFNPLLLLCSPRHLSHCFCCLLCSNLF